MIVNTTNKCNCCYTTPYPVRLDIMRAYCETGAYFGEDGIEPGYGTEDSMTVYYQIVYSDGSKYTNSHSSGYFTNENDEFLNFRVVTVWRPEGLVAGVTETWYPDGYAVADLAEIKSPPTDFHGYVARTTAYFTDRISHDIANLSVAYEFDPKTLNEAFDHYNADGTPLVSVFFERVDL